MTITASTPVDAPQEEVWRTVVDVEDWPAWTRSVKSARRLDRGPLAIGSAARIRQPGMPTRTWRVDALDAPSAFSWSTNGIGWAMDGEHHVEPAPAGSRLTLVLRFRGPLGGAMERLTRRKATRFLELEAEGLRRSAEQGVRQPDRL